MPEPTNIFELVIVTACIAFGFAVKKWSDKQDKDAESTGERAANDIYDGYGQLVKALRQQNIDQAKTLAEQAARLTAVEQNHQKQIDAERAERQRAVNDVRRQNMDLLAFIHQTRKNVEAGVEPPWRTLPWSKDH